ncbi:LytTR family DNA-binding domain-containing protein [Sphingoaurantiacus capsulatus]|uniref:LytTR family DNA-binding domain-containing protein n=1 Tax=Sphingoaurantiacus capsulatus TaxID=1771310 RepID=A0ABV7X9K3_9SPHN
MLAAIPVGLLLGFAGPFGTYPALPTATRYGFWLGLTLAGVVAVMAAQAVLPLAKLRAGVARIGAVALLSAVPMTFVVAWTMSLVQPGRVYAPAQLPALFVAVAAVQLLVAWATAVSSAKGEAGAPVLPVSGEAAEPAGFPVALTGKLPADVGREIVAIETEDHYLRVYGAAGKSALILMRMADAVALLDARLGAQVHRRWWVAEGAVAGMEAAGVRLSDGRLVPVGRTFSAAVRARFAARG